MEPTDYGPGLGVSPPGAEITPAAVRSLRQTPSRRYHLASGQSHMKNTRTNEQGSTQATHMTPTAKAVLAGPAVVSQVSW